MPPVKDEALNKPQRILCGAGFACKKSKIISKLKFYYRDKVKKRKFFKTLRQDNAVLRRAALSGSKPAPDRAR